MNDSQLFNFVYWLQEHTNLRGISDETTPHDKYDKILELKVEFLSKYKMGMGGWVDNNQPNIISTTTTNDADEKYISQLEKLYLNKCTQYNNLKAKLLAL